MEEVYAVIFKTKRKMPPPPEYGKLSQRMAELSKANPGFIDIETITDAEGNGVSISYWKSLDAIQEWRKHPEHVFAQGLGASKWYKYFKVEICKVLRSYEGGAG